MSITHRVKRTLATAAAGAMILSLMPVGAVSADEHDGPCDDVPETAFADGEFIAEVFEDRVQCMAAYGITIGVDEVPNFAPGANVSRQQMALFIQRLATQAQFGNTAIPDAPTAPFEDLEVGVPDAQRAAIDYIFELGITEGKTPTTFAPGEDVTREEMATFIFRAHDALGVLDLLETPDTPTVEFPDIDEAEDVHKPAIEALTALGIIQGQDDGNFNPKGSINRQQMSQFISVSTEVLAQNGLWNGVFVGVEPDPDPDPETPDPEFTLEVAADPETPDDVTEIDFTLTLTEDAAESDVDEKYAALAIFPDGTAEADLVVDGEVNLDAAVGEAALEGETDADGVATFPEVGPLPVGTHTLVAWAAEEETNAPDDALAVSITPITVTDSTAIDATFTVLDFNAEPADNDDQGTLLLSTGEALVAFTYDVERDTFLVGGNPATFALVEATLGDVGTGNDNVVTIEVEGSMTEGYTHNFVSAPVETAVVGVADAVVPGNTELELRDFPSGLELADVVDYDGLTLTVDGAPASQTVFQANKSTGDLVELVRDDDDVVVQVNLTNNDPSGAVVEVDDTNDFIRVDVLQDDAFPVDDNDADWLIPGHLVYDVDPANDDYTLVVNGEEVSDDDTDWATTVGNNIIEAADDLATDLEVSNIEATYDRVAGEVTVDVTFDEVETFEFEEFSGVALDLAGDIYTVAVGEDDSRTMTVDGDTAFFIGATATTRVNFDEELTAGDVVTCLDGELTDELDQASDVTCDSISLVNDVISGQVTDEDIAANSTFEVTLDNGYVVTDFADEVGIAVGLDQEPLGFVGQDALFTGNGDDWASSQVLGALQAVNLDVSTVTIVLDEGDDDTFTWEFAGFPNSVFTNWSIDTESDVAADSTADEIVVTVVTNGDAPVSGILAQSFAVTVNGAAVDVATVVAGGAGDNEYTIVLDPADLTDGDDVVVTVLGVVLDEVQAED